MTFSLVKDVNVFMSALMAALMADTCNRPILS